MLAALEPRALFPPARYVQRRRPRALYKYTPGGPQHRMLRKSLLLAEDNKDFAPSASVFVVFVPVDPVRAEVANAHGGVNRRVHQVRGIGQPSPPKNLDMQTKFWQVSCATKGARW